MKQLIVLSIFSDSLMYRSQINRNESANDVLNIG
jgi:hypothetical protein